MAADNPSRTPKPRTYWPRWTSSLLVLCGVVVVVLETTSLLVIGGLVLTGLGIYGLAYRSPSSGRS
jgi:hypothetical protein